MTGASLSRFCVDCNRMVDDPENHDHNPPCWCRRYGVTDPAECRCDPHLDDGWDHAPVCETVTKSQSGASLEPMGIDFGRDTATITGLVSAAPSGIDFASPASIADTSRGGRSAFGGISSMRLPIDPRRVRLEDRHRPQHELSRCMACERFAYRMHHGPADYFLRCDPCAERYAQEVDREMSRGWGTVF